MIEGERDGCLVADRGDAHQWEEEEEKEVTEKDEGLGMDGMRRGHKLKRMAPPTLLDITSKQDKMNIQRWCADVLLDLRM